MEFGILGPLEVRSEGDDVRLGAAKPRALLVRLLSAQGRPVSSERLIDDLWEGDPPRSAAQTLQTYVSQLRKALGPERVTTGTGTYQLIIDGDRIDATDFEATVAAGRDAWSAGESSRAADSYRRALALWRGPALVDAAGAAWAVAESTRLDELRLVATEGELEAGLALGEPASVVAAAESALAEHPLRERLWALLMLGLYQDGRQAEALRAFQRLREVLREELGLEPSPELCELEGRMLHHDPELRPMKPMVGAVGPTATANVALPTGVVTFLLTDVVGSTQLWEHAPNPMADAVHRHEHLLRDVVEAHNGVMLKARGEGDSTFSVFQRATDAVTAAIDAAAQLESEAWPTDALITVRMALHTGEAVERDGDYYGRTVNRAARLRAAAAPAQLLVSEATSQLVVDDLPPSHRLVPLGMQELRDLERPERVFAIARQSSSREPNQAVTTDDRVPLPRRLATIPAMGFAGREPEREMIAASFKQARTGQSKIVLLAGEPGIGKTSLAASVARDAFDEGATVMFGRGDADAGIPYRPWVEALTALVAHLPTTVFDDLGLRRMRDLARLAPSVRDRLPDDEAATSGDPDADRWAVFDAVAGLLAVCMRDRPLVLVLDDLQWADQPTLLLLRHVVDALADKHLLVVGTYREKELPLDHPLHDVLTLFRRDSAATRVILRGLGDGEIVRMLETAMGQSLEPASLEFAYAVRRETDGNPFFATELLRHLAETGAVYLDPDGHWVPRAELSEVGLPESVREVVARRVRNLGGDCEQLLRIAAVIGQEFDLRTLAAAAGCDPSELVDPVERAESVGLLTNLSADRFAFSHALVAHTLYVDLAATRRSVLHRQVAVGIEALGEQDRRPGELARHWTAAMEPTDSTKAIDYSRKAGDAAITAVAPQEAIRWYAQALELADDRGAPDAVRCDLLVRVGRAQRDSGEDAHCVTLLDAARLARRIGDHRLLARAALANSRGYVGGIDEHIDERIEMLEAALESDEHERRVRARLMATLAVELRGSSQPDRAVALSTEALAIARRLDDSRLIAHVINCHMYAGWDPSNLAERLALTEESVALAREFGDTTLLHWSLQWRVHALVESTAVEEAEQCLAEMGRIADDTWPALLWSSRFYTAAIAALRGDADTADALTVDWESWAAEMVVYDVRNLAIGVQAMIAWHRGDYIERHDRFVSELDRLTEGGYTVPHRFTALEAAMGYLEDTFDVEPSRRHRAQDWSSAFGRLRDEHPQTAENDVGRLGMVCLSVLLAVRRGQTSQMERELAAIEPYRDQIGTTGAFWVGSTAYYAGVVAAALGREGDAEGFFAEAVEVNERIGAAFFLALTQVAWARLLLDRQKPGDPERAVSLLQEARAGAEAHGCHGVLADVEGLLATPPR